MAADYTVNLPTISAADAAIYQTQSGVKSYFSVVPGSTVLATGSITGSTLGVSGFQTIALALSGLTVNSVAWPRNTTIWVGTTAGAKDVGIYRLRKAYVAGSNVMNIGEAGLADNGLIPLDIRSTELGSGLFISVMSDFSPWSITPRIIIGDVPPFYKDYDLPWAYDTTFPPPFLHVGPNTSLFSASHGASAVFSIPTPFITQVSANVVAPYTITYTPPSAWSLAAGANTTTTSSLPFPAVSWNVPPGFWVLQVACHSTRFTTVGGITVGPGGVSADSVRYVLVWCYDGLPGEAGATFTPIGIQEISSDSLGRDGSNMTVKLAQQDAANLRDGTAVNIFDVPWFAGGTPSQIITQRPGWVMSVEMNAEPGIPSATVTIGGTATIAKTMNANSQRVDAIDTTTGAIPASWQEAVKIYFDVMSMVGYLLRYHTNILELVDLHLQTGAVWAVGLAFIVPKGNVWGQITEVASRIQALATCDSQGGIWIYQNPQLIDYGSRTKSTTTNTFTQNDYSTVTIDNQKRPTTGRVIAEGFNGSLYTASTPQALGLPIPFESFAPGGSGGQGVGEERITNLMIIDQAGLNKTAGMFYAWKNNPYPKIDITLPGNYWGWEPGVPQWHYLQVPASAMPNNQAFNKYVIINSATRSHKENGEIEVKLTAEGETYDLPGVTIVIPPPVDKIPPPRIPPPPPTKPNPCSAGTWPTGWSVQTGVMGPTPGANPPASSAVKGVLQPAVLEYGLYPTLIRSKAVVSYTFPSPQTVYSFSLSVAEGWVGTYESGWPAVTADSLNLNLYDSTGTLIFNNTFGGPADSTVAIAAIDWNTTGHTGSVTFFLGDRANVSRAEFVFISRPGSSLSANRAYAYISAAQVCTR